MAIPPESIEAGKCYLSGDGRLRRVMGVRPNGEVRYKYRSFPAHSKQTWRTSSLPPEIFAATVQREVPCDWTPEEDG